MVDGVTVPFSTGPAAGYANTTARASQSIEVYTGGVSGKRARGSWIVLAMCGGFVTLLGWY